MPGPPRVRLGSGPGVRARGQGSEALSSQIWQHRRVESILERAAARQLVAPEQIDDLDIRKLPQDADVALRDAASADERDSHVLKSMTACSTDRGSSSSTR